MKIFEGNYNGKGKKIAVVASRFNSLIVEQLIRGAEDALVRNGVSADDIKVYKVPGAFEIPYFCRKVSQSGKYDCVIALGAVIRGETPHFDYVSSEVSKGVSSVSLNSEIPVIFGVLTTDTTEQALERAGVKSGNKGFESGMAALECMDLLSNI